MDKLSLLKDKAENGSNSTVRRRAMEKLNGHPNNFSFLKEIATSHQIKQTRIDALDLIFDQIRDDSLLIEIIEHHPSPKIRKRAVRRLSNPNPEFLQNIIKNDTSSSVQIAAIDVLNDQELLIKILLSFNLPIKVKKSIILRLRGYEKYKEIINALPEYTETHNYQRNSLIKYIRKKIVQNTSEENHQKLFGLLRLNSGVN